MKKVLTFVLVLALVCGLAVTAMAAGFNLNVNNKLVQAGETVTAKITLDEEVPEAMQVQIELSYNGDALTYTSHSLGEGYDFLSVTPSKKSPVVKISWVDLAFAGKSLPAGTVIEVVFTAKESVDASAVNISATTKIDGADAGSASVAITVCPGHNYVESKIGGSCLSPAKVVYTCEFCGDSYDGESDGVYGAHEIAFSNPGFEPTCTEEGMKAYWYCGVCGKTFGDEACTVEIDSNDLLIPATGHIKEENPCYEYPYEDDSFDMVYHCAVCGCDSGIVVERIVCTAGTEENPIAIYDENYETGNIEFTTTIPAGTTLYYGGRGIGGTILNIPAAGLKVAVDGVELTAVNGYYTCEIPAGGWFAPPVSIAVTNTTGADITVEMNFNYPVGSYMNPDVLCMGENTGVVAADNWDGYIYNWTAPCNGTLVVSISTDASGWILVMNNLTTYQYGDIIYSDEAASNVATIDVVKGDVIEISANTYDPATFSMPGGTIVLNAYIECAHDVTHVDAVAPSCFAEGNIEYWYCANCEMFWANEELTQLTNSKNVILPAACQEIIHVEAVEATCTSNGNVEYWYCANEEHGTVWIDEAMLQISNHMNVIIPAGCYDIIHVEGVEPGCHYDGVQEHWYCNGECGTVWVDEAMLQISNHKNVIIPALGGDVVHVEAAEATCTQAGNVEYWYCEECEQVWANEELTQLTNRKNVITEAAKGHEYDDDKDMICNVCEFDRTNSQTGDFTIVAAVAAAVVSMTGIVALPVAKKKFF